jgi:hypothetical protein
MVPEDEQKPPNDPTNAQVLQRTAMPRCSNGRPGRTDEKRRGIEPASRKTQASHVRWEQKEVRTDFKKKRFRPVRGPKTVK